MWVGAAGSLEPGMIPSASDPWAAGPASGGRILLCFGLVWKNTAARRLLQRGCNSSACVFVVMGASQPRPGPFSPFLRHSRPPFGVQRSPSTDPFTAVLFPVCSSTSPKSVCHRTCRRCALPSSREMRDGCGQRSRHTCRTASSPMLAA